MSDWKKLGVANVKRSRVSTTLNGKAQKKIAALQYPVDSSLTKAANEEKKQVFLQYIAFCLNVLQLSSTSTIERLRVIKREYPLTSEKIDVIIHLVERARDTYVDMEGDSDDDDSDSDDSS